MSTIPASELAVLVSLSGYEQMLQIDQLARQYGVEDSEVQRQLAALSVQDTTTSPTGYNGAGEYDPSAGRSTVSQNQKVDPFDSEFSQPSTVASAKLIDKSNLHYEYDPTEGAKQRRAQIDQAILCPACGVRLGIPSTRPIKVTCPQCLHEETFSA
jgi:DNA-binding transcriptional MocR family regulator